MLGENMTAPAGTRLNRSHRGTLQVGLELAAAKVDFYGHHSLIHDLVMSEPFRRRYALATPS